MFTVSSKTVSTLIPENFSQSATPYNPARRINFKAGVPNELGVTV